MSTAVHVASVEDGAGQFDRRLAYAMLGLMAVILLLVATSVAIVTISGLRAERARLITNSVSLLAPGIETARASGRFRVQRLVEGLRAASADLVYVQVTDAEGVVAHDGLKIPEEVGEDWLARATEKTVVRELDLPGGRHVTEAVVGLQAGYERPWRGVLRMGLATEPLGDLALRAAAPIVALCGLVFLAAWPLALRMGRRLGAPVKQTEAEKNRLAVAVSSINEGLAVVSGDRVSTVNPAFAQLVGQTETALLGRPISTVLAGDAEVADILAMVTSAPWQGRIQARREGAEPWTCDVSVTPLPDREDEAVWVVRDVDRETLLEEQLRQAQKIEAIGQLAGGVAHDFNNLLTIVTSGVELLRESELHPDDVELLVMIQSAADRGADLTRQILAFARRQVLSPVSTELGPVVRQCADLLTRVLPASVHMTLEVADGLWPVVVDAHQVHQVLMNLSINARDAMPDGGQLSLLARNQRLDPVRTADGQMAPAGDYVVLTIRDTGTGISEAKQSRIFEPFFTTKGVGEGTGLGLAVVLGIVQQSGGHLRLESREGEGTAFHVAFARAEGDPESSQPVELGPLYPSAAEQQACILLVEDEPVVRKFVAATLGRVGYRVIEAPSGDAALDRVTAGESIDLVLTDLSMPGMSGAELIQRLRVSHPELPTVLMSGYSALVSTQMEMLADTPIIDKPLTREALVEAIERRLKAAELV